MGSNTRPPCDEGVRHVILKKIQPIAADQLAKFTNQIEKSEFAKGGNNRMIMPMGERQLLFTEDPLGINELMQDEADKIKKEMDEAMETVNDTMDSTKTWLDDLTD